MPSVDYVLHVTLILKINICSTLTEQKETKVEPVGC